MFCSEKCAHAPASLKKYPQAQCEICGSALSLYQAKYCSRECTAEARKGKNRKEYEQKLCLGCGELLSREQLRHGNTYCSYECSKGKERQFKPESEYASVFNEKYQGLYLYVGGYVHSAEPIRAKCLTCDTVITVNAQCTRKGHDIKRCKSCYAIEIAQGRKRREQEKRERQEAARREAQERAVERAAREAKEKKARIYIKHCEECGVRYETNNSRRLCCSDECSRKRANRARDIKRRDKKRNNGDFDASISLRLLAKRDGNTCHICGGKCDKTDCFYDKNGIFIAGNMYPSIDHVIALSNGGTHTWGNVKLAHRLCNTYKGNSVVYEVQGGQLRLTV